VEERYPDRASQPLLVERILDPQPSFEHMSLAEYQQHLFTLQQQADEAEAERREQAAVNAEIEEEIRMREQSILYRGDDHEDLYAHLYPFGLLVSKPNGHHPECVCGSCDPEPPDWFVQEHIEWARQPEQADNAYAHLILLNLSLSDVRLEGRSTREGVEDRLREYTEVFVDQYDWFAGQGFPLIQEGEYWEFPSQPQPELVDSEVVAAQMTGGEEYPF
jgi:hypothetical protein